MNRPQPVPSILEISAYVPGAQGKGEGGEPPLKLSANESALGPSPQAIAALQAKAADAHRYPEADPYELRHALAKRYNLPAQQFICGAGSDEILTFAAQTFLRPGDEALYPEHGFLMYKISTLAAGGAPKTAPEKGLQVDVDALLAAVTGRTRLVWLANPGNPTGSIISGAEVRRLHEGLPKDVMLVLDGAYQEFVEDPAFSNGTELVLEGAENVLVTGTLSKMFGLGGLRVGWGFAAPYVIDLLNRVRGPFNISVPSLAAAVAALQDPEHERKVLRTNNDQIAALKAELEAMGLQVHPTFTNFMLIDFGTEEERKRIDTALQAQGIFIRQVAAYGLPTCLRMTLGTREENTRVLSALRQLV